MNNTKSIVTEFGVKSDLYKDYGVAVNNLVESLLKKHNYKCQLSHRIKSLESLKEKIRRKRHIGKIYRKLSEIEDVVGIRAVFYTETERRNFLRDISHALGGTLKIEETSKISGYRSTHAIITFGEERIRLDEYKRFRGLKCELQITLILNHAWAEVEHDIFYKDGHEVHNLNKKSYSALKEKMEKVMRDYIQKASSGLESITKHIRRLETQK
jgi:ppGpp synthetase/RelA/SpoT-type nucleotidyltranferase